MDYLEFVIILFVVLLLGLAIGGFLKGISQLLRRKDCPNCKALETELSDIKSQLAELEEVNRVSPHTEPSMILRSHDMYNIPDINADMSHAHKSSPSPNDSDFEVSGKLKSPKDLRQSNVTGKAKKLSEADRKKLDEKRRALKDRSSKREASSSANSAKVKLSSEQRRQLDEKRKALKARLPESETRSDDERLRIAKDAQIKLIKTTCKKHFSALQRNLRKSLEYDDYGKLQHDGRRLEVMNFLRSTGISTRAIEGREAIDIVLQTVSDLQKEAENMGFTTENFPEDGLDFEHWVAEALQKFGWRAKATNGGGDQGVDVIAEKDGIQWAIQCKRYKQPVGNKAVQEAFSGVKYYSADRGAVITNAGYTESAKQLAASTGIRLLSLEDIPTLQP